jgi:hypothetical protein
MSCMSCSVPSSAGTTRICTRSGSAAVSGTARKPSTRHPSKLEESGAKSAGTPIGELGLEQGQRIAYLFDYGDNWEVDVSVVEIRAAGADSYPQVLERVGEAPPQYESVDEHEE